MTVAAIVPRNDYVGTGSVNIYAYGFKIVAESDLLVIKADLSGVETVLTLGIDYGLTGVGSINGGNVVLTNDLESGFKLTILQDVPLEQETSIRNDSEYYASIHEDTFDTGRRIDQQIAEALGRAIAFKKTSTATGIYVGDIVPDSVLLSNSAGDGLDWADSSDFAGTTNHFLLTNIGVNTHFQIDDHIGDLSNPHATTKAQVGLANADNTADLDKPISNLTQTALNAKANTADLGSAAYEDVTAFDSSGAAAAVQSSLNLHTADTSNPHSTTKSQVGLGNADNTSDLNKPISTATQTALDLKFNAADIAGYVPYVGATQDIDLGNAQRIVGLLDPALDQDAATKKYVDDTIDLIPIPATTPLSITMTGDMPYDFPYRLTNPLNIEIDGVVTQYSGKTITSFTYAEQGNDFSNHLLTLSFDDLEGITGDFTPSTLRTLTSLSCPALKYVGGNFSPSSSNTLTTLSMPELEVVGGNLTPSAFSSLTSLTFPKLASVLGSITPATFSALTTISCPELKTVGVTLSVTSLTALTTFSFPKLEDAGNSISIATANALTSVDFSMLTRVANAFTLSGASTITTLALPELLSIGGGLTTATVASLTTITIPKLIQVGGAFNVTGSAFLTTLSAPALTTVGGSFQPNNMGSLSTLNFPVLASIASAFSLTNLASLGTASFPSLTNISGAVSTTGTVGALATVSFPAMATYGATINFTAATNIVTASIGVPGTLKRISGATVSFSGCKLNQTSVDGILAAIATLDGTNGTTTFGAGKTLTLSGGTNATPSAAGLVDKAIIQARGATVLTN